MRAMLKVFGTAAVTALSAPAAAQSNGFYLDGFIGADYVTDGGGMSGRSWFGDLSAGLAPESGLFGRVGFEIGLFGFGMNVGGAGTSETIPFGGVTFALGGGRLLVGLPQSAAHEVGPGVLPTNSSIARLQLLTSGYYPLTTILPILVNERFYGIRYDRSSGATDYAVTLSRLDLGFGTANAVSGAILHDFGSSGVFGNFEVLTASGAPTVGSVMIGGHTMLSSAGSSLGEVDVGGFLAYADDGSDQGTVANLYATVRPMDRLSISASVLRIDRMLSSTLYGLNATYDVWNGVGVNLGYGTTSGGGDLWTVGLHREF